MSFFRITRKKGFHIEFDNGYTVSVQFGPGNYCDNYDKGIGSEDEICGADGSTCAEVAVLKKGDLIKMKGWTDTVEGRVTSEELLKIMNSVAKKKGGKP